MPARSPISDAADFPTQADSRNRKRRRSVGKGPVECQVCHRTYERADHLQRHLDSRSIRQPRVCCVCLTSVDRNERPFRCQQCPAAFNRRDLLLRHEATHAKNAAEGQIGPNRTAERAARACDACVLSKVKCDNVRPCRVTSSHGP
jgi:hypothetical protein